MAAPVDQAGAAWGPALLREACTIVYVCSMGNLARALTLGFAVVAGGLLSAAGGCSSETRKAVAEGCLVNTDCAEQLVCVFRRCHVQCVTSRDCDPGQLCVASDRPYRVCQLKEEQRCAHNSDCPTGQSCAVDLQCRDQCFATQDCLEGQLCVAGTCAEELELRDGGLLSKRPEADAGSGQPCLYTSQCPSPFVCRNNLCSSECLAASDCTAGYDCVNNRCVASSGTLIGVAGGVVTASGGKVKLTVPPNALRAPVSILMLRVDAWPDGALGQVYQIEPNGLQFLAPATLTISYTAAEIGGVSASALHVAQATGSSWVPLTSTVDTTARTVTSELAHLSVYGLIGSVGNASPATDGGAAEPAIDASMVPDANRSSGTTDAALAQANATAPVRSEAGAASGAP